MDVYRINKEPHHTNPLSIVGSERYGGRWNPKGQGILYTSRTPELALLETLVHLPPVGLADIPQLWLSTIRLPNLTNGVFWLDPTRLPAHWQTGTLAETQSILAEWLAEPFSLTIGVPSAVLAVSYNLLLHPDHPAFEELRVIHQQLIPLDLRG